MCNSWESILEVENKRMQPEHDTKALAWFVMGTFWAIEWKNSNDVLDELFR